MKTDTTVQSRREQVRADRYLLAVAFPQCFVAPGAKALKRPIKVGIHRDVNAAGVIGLDGVKVSNVRLRRALFDYTRGPKYLKALIAGGDRIDLTGTAVGTVPPEVSNTARVILARATHGQKRAGMDVQAKPVEWEERGRSTPAFREAARLELESLEGLLPCQR